MNKDLLNSIWSEKKLYVPAPQQAKKKYVDDRALADNTHVASVYTNAKTNRHNQEADIKIIVTPKKTFWDQLVKIWNKGIETMQSVQRDVAMRIRALVNGNTGTGHTPKTPATQAQNAPLKPTQKPPLLPKMTKPPPQLAVVNTPAKAVRQQAAKPDELKAPKAVANQKTGEELLALAEAFLKENASRIQSEPQLATTLHQLYDRAATQLLGEGQIEKALDVRRQIAEGITFSPSHCLHDMTAAIQKASEGKNIGAHFSHLDTGILKGGHVSAFTRNVEGQTLDIFHFKIGYNARNELQKTFDALKNNKDALQNHLPAELRAAGVNISEIDHIFLGKEPTLDGEKKGEVFSAAAGYAPEGAKALKIDFPGVGKVIIGNSKSYGSLYNDVHVEIDSSLPPGEGIKRMHQMLAFLGFGPILGEQRNEDAERMKLALLYRTYCPDAAIKIETTKNFYDMPVEELRTFIEKRTPEMKYVFAEDLGTLQEVEIYPGKLAWSVNDLSLRMREAGAIGLMAGVAGSIEDASTSIAQIIVNGALSSQDRFECGLFKEGVSSKTDLMRNSGDQVFTRLITKDLIKEYIGEFRFSGAMQILYDLDVVNRGCYGFTGDQYGAKNPHYYEYRNYENRTDMVRHSQRLHFAYTNEVMVKNRIPPSAIRGVMVKDEKAKELLVQKLNEQGLVSVDAEGNPFVLGKPLDEFILIGEKFDRKGWNKPTG